ncbi:MAG: hypothetical protein Q7S60_01770 [bacterium]|nr:hypothetical protein [bacterium]
MVQLRSALVLSLPKYQIRMHAYLITGGGIAERTAWAENFFKSQEITEIIRIPRPMKNHLIKMVRELIHTLLFAPINPERGRGVIMEDANLLTTEAANSFLKTLEEPIGNTTLMLTAPSREAVLATIASRTMHIDLGTTQFKIDNDEREEAEATFVKLTKAGVGERLEFVEGIGKREEAIDFCVGQIFAVREVLRNKANGKADSPLPITQLTALITHLEQTRQDLEANVNVKLSLTELLLDYPSGK